MFQNIPQININNFSQNISHLHDFYPPLYEKVVRSSAEKLFEKTQNNTLTLKLNGLYVESKYDPERDAMRRLPPVEMKSDTLIFFIGCGLGYHINGVLKNRNEKAVLIEGNVDIFRASLYVIDPRIFRTITPVIGVDKSALRELIGSLSVSRFTVVKHERSIQFHRDFYRSAGEIIYSRFRELTASEITEKAARRLWVRNVLRNLAHVRGNYFGTRSLCGQFTGPVILVASGPYVEDVCPALRRWSKKYPVFTILPSVPYLLRQGIRPDFIVTTDASFWNRYRGVAALNLPLVTTYSADYGLLKGWEGDIFFFSHGLQVERAFHEIRYRSVTIPMQGTAAIVMIVLARSFGFTKLYLAGFDFAYNGIKDHHVGAGFDGYFNTIATRLRNWQTMLFERLRDDRFVTVKDCYGNDIGSSHKLILYKNWLEREVNRDDLLRLNNGAHIAGLSPVSLRIPDQFDGCPKDDFLERVRRVKHDGIVKHQVLDDFRRLQNNLTPEGEDLWGERINQVYELFYGPIQDSKNSLRQKDDAIFAVKVFQKSLKVLESL